jgi:hypothetical protein
MHRLDRLVEQARVDIRAIPREWVESKVIASHPVQFAVLRRELGAEGTLVLVRAFVHTWRFPNFIAFGTIGHVRADGIIVSPDGAVSPASEAHLWEFR